MFSNLIDLMSHFINRNAYCVFTFYFVHQYISTFLWGLIKMPVI